MKYRKRENFLMVISRARFFSETFFTVANGKWRILCSNNTSFWWWYDH